MEDPQGFQLMTAAGQVIRFHYYLADAPMTALAFHAALPFKSYFIHARVSGEEIWTEHPPLLQVIQENASVFCQPGEVVIGPIHPQRVLTSGLMGIYYGEGKGLDAANIFAKVFDDDLNKLKELGDQVWKHGQQELTLETL